MRQFDATARRRVPYSVRRRWRAARPSRQGAAITCIGPAFLSQKPAAARLEDASCRSLPEADEAWIGAFAAGLFACAKRYGVDLVGGDTTRGPLNLCLTALGEVPAGKALRRSGAQAGDDLWVSGQPGLAALGLAHLQGRTQLPETLAARCVTALQRPLPRVELGLALQSRGQANAAIDVSDGLLADLGHLLERSGLAAEVFGTQLPWLPAGTDPQLARQCQLAAATTKLLFPPRRTNGSNCRTRRARPAALALRAHCFRRCRHAQRAR
jgi:hypothetical protein